MRDKLKSFLKHWPLFYCFVQSWYWKVCSLKAYLFGTKINERRWSKRHFYKGGDWIASYWNSQSHPHRLFLLEKISNFSPFSSILEVGCNCGPNLFLLAKKFPNAEIRGIDINPAAVQTGTELFTQEGILNVKLAVGKADNLSQFQDKSLDIIFTDAVLLYIGPDKIKKVIKEMIRVARKALIFVEWHDENQKGLGKYDAHIGVWKRNYLDLLKSFVREDQICIYKIPGKFWPDENWKKLGYVIEIKI